jgi:putative transposase
MFLNNSLSTQNDTWLTVREVAGLTGLPSRTVLYHCKSGRYDARLVKGAGGKQYQINLSSLPPETRAKYFSSKFQSQDNELLNCDETEVEAELYARAPEWARKRADKYLTLFRATEGLKGSALRNFLIQWNKEHENTPDLQTSYSCLTGARKTYKKHGISGLLAQYGKNKGVSSVKKEWGEYYKTIYLKEGAPSAQSCWYYTLGYARSLDPSITKDNFPSVKAFLRWIDNEIPEQAQYMARYGAAAHNRKYASYIERDYSNVAAGEMWVSDHAQIDVAVMLPDGKACFPWVTAWRDFKTGKWLGWYVHAEAPNSDHIFYSFYLAALEHGLPQKVLIDNGKDYRCRDFAGGRVRRVKVTVDEVKANGMLHVIGVSPRFAQPYNAQTKPIERDFLKNKELFSKHMVGYRGGDVTERPEILADEIKSGKILTVNEFDVLFDSYIRTIRNRMVSKGKNLQGRSPDEAWAEEFKEKRFVDKDSLRLFCMRTSRIVTIGRNGIRDSDLQVTYWAEWMSGVKGVKVYLRRDLKDYAQAWVHDARTDELLGKARIAEFVAPALAETEIEKSELRAALAAKNRDRKITRAYASVSQAPTPQERLFHLKTGTDAFAVDIDPSPKILHVQSTLIDQAIKKDREMQAEHTADLSSFQPPERRKAKIYLFESDIPSKEDVMG